jgi:radical SAM superfamily enzyme YgiQ (UPF0313 family)
MRIELILPALTEARSPFFRPVKYALFPPLGLATLAGYLGPGDQARIQDEHVEELDTEGTPDLVAIEVYITATRRAYRLADHYRRRGAHVALGGLHVTSRPEEAARHADTIFLGPGEDTWPRFLEDLRSRRPRPVYRSAVRTLDGLPSVRRDLVRRERYLVPNSLVVSRGCPHSCGFCYKDAFFEGGRSFYVQRVDDALAEIERLPGRHLYFLDDHLFGHPRFAAALFEGMRGMRRVWQAAGTVDSVLRPGLLEKAAACGLRSLFVGFETLDAEALRAQGKLQNLGRDYATAVRRLHDHGVMVNGSFVFGMDEHDASVFDRTVEWAIGQGIETATFHVLTPYPGTALFRRMAAAGRLRHRDWDRYDTRHAVFQPARMSPDELERGYWRAYRDFYRYGSIFRGAAARPSLAGRLRHAAYAIGWKKCEPVWDLLIRGGWVGRARPLLEAVLDGAGRAPTASAPTVVSGAVGGTGFTGGYTPSARSPPWRSPCPFSSSSWPPPASLCSWSPSSPGTSNGRGGPTSSRSTPSIADSPVAPCCATSLFASSGWPACPSSSGPSSRPSTSAWATGTTSWTIRGERYAGRGACSPSPPCSPRSSRRRRCCVTWASRAGSASPPSRGAARGRSAPWVSGSPASRCRSSGPESSSR